MKKIIRFFSKPKRLAILNAVMLAVLSGFNFLIQGLGVPVPYAIALLVVCFCAIILYPIIDHPVGSAIISFVNGISLMLVLYCVCFMGDLFALLLCIITILPIIPVFFLIVLIYQLIHRYIVKPTSPINRWLFVLGVALCLAVMPIAGHEYHKASTTLRQSASNGYSDVEKTYMVERIMGMHFIYHTQYCPFDGWRPPKHDPFLTIGRWLNKGIDPIDLPLEERLHLYRTTFPDRPYKFKHAASLPSAKNGYFRDELWTRE